MSIYFLDHKFKCYVLSVYSTEGVLISLCRNLSTTLPDKTSTYIRKFHMLIADPAVKNNVGPCLCTTMSCTAVDESELKTY